MRGPISRSAALLSLGIAASLVSLACGPAPEDTAVTVVPASAPSRLQVVNKSSADMEIFAVQGGQSTRIGVAAANRTTEFPINGISAGTRFEARQVAENGSVVNSQSSGNGTAIILQIPPS